MKSRIINITKTQLLAAPRLGLVAALLVLAAPTTVVRAGGGDDGNPNIAPANSHAYGMTLAEWLSTYWRWYYTGADPAQSTVGHVQLMPLPAGDYISGSGTPTDPALYRGRLEITLAPGTPFVLPEFAWVWERYYNGTPDDVPMDNAVALAGAHPVLTIDGKTVLSDKNKAAYYVPVTPFDPIVVYPAPSSYGSIAALSFQGIGIVGRPLSAGVHVIHLYEPLIIPAGAYAGLPDGLGLIYDNTWNITVLPEDLGNPRIFPPDSRPQGKTYSEWSAKWWQWGMEHPLAGHPFVDSPDFDVRSGQHGDVWFLAAPFGTVERTVTIPEGKELFVGLVNAEASDLEGLGNTEPEQRATAKFYADHIVNLSCTIDSAAVQNIGHYRVASPQFEFTAPEPWIFSPAPGGHGTSVADGFYLMLRPLSKGAHTIHYGGAFHFSMAEGDPFNWDGPLDMTYHVSTK
jgi:hypothetical protein